MNNMRYKKFGNTDLNLSELAVGTWAIGGTGWGDVNEKDSIDAILTMVDQGVNLIDTAPSYGRGHSEIVVGKALASCRDKVTLLTKCGIRWPEDAKYGSSKPIHDSSKAAIIKQCEDSLTRLQTDHIDIYLIHWPDLTTPFEETVDALNTLKQQGKILYTGISNFDDDQLEQLYALGAIDVIQYPYSMVNRKKEAVLKSYAEKGVYTMGYGGLGAGILTGTIRELPQFEPGDARIGFYDFFEEPKFSKVMELLKTLDKIAETHNVPVAQVAVNWTTQHPYIGASLTGVRNPKEALENCSAFTWSLTDDELTEIDKAIKATVGI